MAFVTKILGKILGNKSERDIKAIAPVVAEINEEFEATMALNMSQWLSIPFVLPGIFLVVRAMKLPEKIYKNS